MILVIDNEDGSKKQIVVPDNAREMTDEDKLYFLNIQNEKQERLERNAKISELNEDILNAKRNISECMRCLSNTDYQAIKHFEGELSDVDFAPVKTQRKAWRDEINSLEAFISTKQEIIDELVKEN